MATTQIKTNYALASGEAYSDEMTNVIDANISWKVSGNTAETQIVKFEFYGKCGSEDEHQIKDGDKILIRDMVIGNDSGNINVKGLNLSSLRIKIIPATGMDGVLNMYYNS